MAMASENILLAITIVCSKTCRVLKVFKDTTTIIDIYNDLHPLEGEKHELLKAECQSCPGQWTLDILGQA